MDWNDILAAFALYLVLEGILPFASPAAWRDAVRQIAEQPEPSIRRMGLICMVCGVVLLYIVRGNG